MTSAAQRGKLNTRDVNKDWRFNEVSGKWVLFYKWPLVETPGT